MTSQPAAGEGSRAKRNACLNVPMNHPLPLQAGLFYVGNAVAWRGF
jgi:hypothetical protein